MPSSSLDRNRQIALEFHAQALRTQSIAGATPFLAAGFLSHDPHWGSGAALALQLKRLYADGDFVLLHSHLPAAPGSERPAHTRLDILRFEKERLLEHWCVSQPIGSGGVNPNGPFYGEGALLHVPPRPGAVLEANRIRVLACYTDIIVNQRFERAQQHFGAEYRQHNQECTDGIEALREFLIGLHQRMPRARWDYKRLWADGDYVLLHSHVLPDYAGPDPGVSALDIFRLEHARVVEHWDIIQPLTESDLAGPGPFYNDQALPRPPLQVPR